MVIAFIIGSDATLPSALPMLIVLNPKKTQFITFNQANSPLLLPSNHPRSQSLISTEHHVTAAFSASPIPRRSPQSTCQRWNHRWLAETRHYTFMYSMIMIPLCFSCYFTKLPCDFSVEGLNHRGDAHGPPSLKNLRGPPRANDITPSRMPRLDKTLERQR